MEKQRTKTNFVPIGGIIGDVLDGYRREFGGGILQVWQIWDCAVGEDIAKNARPAAVKGALLLVHVTNSAWIHQLQFLKKDIISKLNAALGKDLIVDIKFKIGAP